VNTDEVLQEMNCASAIKHFFGNPRYQLTNGKIQPDNLNRRITAPDADG